MTARPRAPLVGVLLVGGASRRFGSPKQLAPWRGATLGEAIATALAAATGEVVLAGGGEVAPALAGLARVADAPGVSGPIAGLLGALRALPDRTLLAAACDQPLLDAAALSWLAGRWRPGALAVLARLAPGGIEPLPGLYAPTSRAVLAELAAAGGSLQPLAARADVVVTRPPAGLRRAWTGVDRPQELAALAAPAAESFEGRRA